MMLRLIRTLISRQSGWSYMVHRQSLPQITTIPRYASNSTIASSCVSDKQHHELSQEDHRKLMQINLELHELFEGGKKVCNPDLVTPEQWRYLMTLRSYTARRREFEFIGLSHIHKQISLKKRKDAKINGPILRAKELEKRANDKHIVYGIGHTAMFIRFSPNCMAKIYNTRWMRAKILDAPTIIFDFGYDEFMIKKYLYSIVRQFEYLYSANRRDQLPFHIQICNAKSNSRSMKVLKSMMPSVEDDYTPIDMHSGCYTELHSLDKLVYLTPYSPNLLNEYNPDDVYIIGALIDRGWHGAITTAKVKRQGIRTAWLPLSRYMDWGNCPKCLPINILCDILREAKRCRDWQKAMQLIPQRLRKQPRQERHMLHKIIGDVTERDGRMPRIHWNEVRDNTRATDGLRDPFKTATANDDGLRSPFKTANDIDPLKFNPFA